jgi:hypothetical protein
MRAFVFAQEVKFLADCMKHRDTVLFDEVNADNRKLYQNFFILTQDSQGLYDDADLYDDTEYEPDMATNDYFIVKDCCVDEIHHDIISIFGSEEVLVRYTVDEEEGDFITIISLYDDIRIHIDCDGNIGYSL